MKPNQKLELTWIGKGHEPKLEPRILIEQPEFSYGDPDSGNMLIQGDNLLALKALEQEYAGKVKCIYIDPPYNTGNAFEHYDDGIEHSQWLNLMAPRLKILRDLLTTDGTIWISLDDNEVHYSKVVLDEIFGRSNFINQVSVKMKLTAGASGGGEDKKLKKNIEYLLVYAKDYDLGFPKFNDVYDEENLFDLIEAMRDEGKSWKYTRVLKSFGIKEFVSNITDGSGESIKIFRHTDVVMEPITNIMKSEGISERDCYVKYFDKIFRDTNAQSSIRTRIIEAVAGNGDFFSIEYTPRSGKNKGKITTLYYKGIKCDLIAWLRDVAVKKGSQLLKLEKTGTYWEGFPLNNLTKEGNVRLPNGKKPEALIQKILELSTSQNDIVFDSFLGSGTTAAVAHKMGRRWIGIELGDHAKTHCVPRLKQVIAGSDQGGISKVVEWQGGGGFKFYTLAPSLLNKDKYDNWIISKEYNPDMLAAAMAKQSGFRYEPDGHVYWKQGRSSEKDYIYTTTQFMTVEILEKIREEMGPDESLMICAKIYQRECENRFQNITVKKIPQMLLGKCEFGKEDYSLNIVNLPHDDVAAPSDDEAIDERIDENPGNEPASQSAQTNLFY